MSDAVATDDFRGFDGSELRHPGGPSSVASMRGRFVLPVSAAVRESAGVAAGDNVEEPRCFDGLSYGNRQRHVLAIEAAKTTETRQRRIAKTVASLREGRA